MRFSGTPEFLSDLRLKRLKVRDMYYSLLGGADETPDILLSLRDELPDDAVRDYLSFKGFKDTGSALRNINGLTDQLSAGKTIRERTLLRKTIPAFLEQIVKSANKDRALGMLVTFIQKIGNHESYIDLLRQRDDTREVIVCVFSQSSYLTRLLLGLDNLEGIFEYPDIRTNYRSLQERLVNLIDRSSDPLNAVREFKVLEELKSGMLFLKGFIDAYVFSQTLSMLADAAIRALVHHLRAEKGFAVIGLGGFGARDLNIGSDLDLLFTGSGESGGRGHAEELIRFLSEYTSKGVAYKVDMRLRPDGSQGVLVKDIESYESYYLKSAQPWEIQSLLRARPVAGDISLLRAFQQMKRRTIMKRGVEIIGPGMRDMRKRIVREVSKESSGYDLKAGPGGIKEIEFLVQYLQLKHIRKFPHLIIFDTVSAIKRLAKYGILDVVSEGLFLRFHGFLKAVDTLLRLNEEDVLKTDSELLDIIVVSLKLRSRAELIEKIEKTRRKVVEAVDRFYT
jgi:glutamate-ammonia-ligase adenylyltransferase